MKKNNKNNEEQVNKKGLVAIVVGLLILVILVVGVTYQVYLYRETGDSIINRIMGREPINNNDNNGNNNANPNNENRNTNTNTNTNRVERHWWDWIIPWNNNDEKIPEDISDVGTITMVYTESNDGITIENAVPMSDAEGKVSTKENEIMTFNVSVNIIKNAKIKYSVVAEKIDTSTLDPKYVKMYLEKSDNTTTYTDVVFEPKRFTELSKYSDKEVLIDEDVVTKSTINYYRLRMWLSSDYPVDDVARTFKVRVNVYGKEQTN